MDNAYQWVPFYEALADKLLTYSDKRNDLFALMKKVSSEQPLMKYLHFEREDWWEPRHHQIDPFSVIGVMNRGTKDANRTVLAKVLADAFDVKLPAPTQFAGIPVLDNRSPRFVFRDSFTLSVDVKITIFGAISVAQALTILGLPSTSTTHSPHAPYISVLSSKQRVGI
jgi:hypothetical protein